ncbi:WD40 repeat-like protein, partial [Violaceomyces palustris]
LCLACSSNIPTPSTNKTASTADRPFIHSCCSRPICPSCYGANPRLITFCPLCEDVTTAFRKGPRRDVTRIGQVVWDWDHLWLPPQPGGGDRDHPPPYPEPDPPSKSQPDGQGGFVIQEEEDDDEDGEGGKQDSDSGGAEMELDDPIAREGEEERSEKLSIHHPNATPSADQGLIAGGGDGDRDGTTKYWLRPNDTLQGLSIRFNIATHRICKINNLPASTTWSNPNLLHTRSFILLPTPCVAKVLNDHTVSSTTTSSPSEIDRALKGPPRLSREEKTRNIRRETEARFLAREETCLADPKLAAKVYVGLVEEELNWVDFGEAEVVGKDGAEVEASRRPQADCSGANDEDEQEGIEKGLDQARKARYQVILAQAVAKWEMDSVWERQQRLSGRIGPEARSPSRKKREAEEGKGKGKGMGSWLSSIGKMLSPNGQEAVESDGGDRRTEREEEEGGSRAPAPPELRMVRENRFRAHSGPVNTVRYNSSGKYLLSGGSDRQIRLWNSKTTSSPSSAIRGLGGVPLDECIQTYSGHSYEILGLDISSDNSKFVSGGGDKSVMVWDVSTGEIVRRFSGHVGKINDVKFGGVEFSDRSGIGGGEVEVTSSSLVLTGGFDSKVRIFDMRSRGNWRPIMQLEEARDSITCIQLDGKEKILTSSVDGNLRTYDLRYGELRCDLIDVPITSLSLPRPYDNRTVLITTLDSKHRLLQLETGECLTTLRGHTNTSYRCHSDLLSTEKGGGDLALGGDEEGNVFLWDTLDSNRRSEARPSDQDGKPILWSEFNPVRGVDQFVTAGADGSVAVW